MLVDSRSVIRYKSVMPKNLEQCIKSVMEQGKSEESAHTICTAQFKDTYSGEFRDAVVFNASEKQAISVRDGVIEYLGIELKMNPPDQVFTVYRSPATIANTAPKMRGIPITDDHVSLDVTPPSDGGFVAEAKMIDASDPNVKATIAIHNQLALSDTLLAAVEAGKRELSLGYHADLIPHDEYDFEQRNIRPHHLAALQSGRCGSMCSFIDRKPTTENNPTTEDETMKLHKAFCDAEGAMNLQQIVELSTALPEAIKAVPVDQLTKLLPALQKIVEAANAVAAPVEGEGEGEMTDEEKAEKEKLAAADAENAALAEKEKLAAADAGTEEERDKPSFSDADMKAATDKAIKAHAATIEKARNFLPETYAFADKSTADIMRDTLATVESEKFADNELVLAFKLLKKSAASYKQFGDSGQQSGFSKLKDKEL